MPKTSFPATPARPHLVQEVHPQAVHTLHHEQQHDPTVLDPGFRVIPCSSPRTAQKPRRQAEPAMPSIIAAAPPRGDHDDGDMPGRPTAAPAAHLGDRTPSTSVPTTSSHCSPDPGFRVITLQTSDGRRNQA